MCLSILIEFEFWYYFYLENSSNHSRRNDEFLNPEEIEKEGVREKEDRIRNNDKKPDDKNILSKENKSISNEDIKNGSESNAVSDDDSDPSLIKIKNSSRKKLKLERLASLNAFIADTSEPDLLYKLEREQIEKEQQENHQNVQVQDNTEEAQIDAATFNKLIIKPFE
ncbi:uncharacterized protein LOC112596827 isoform X2 [Melanaphis sacchari]|uniref:uncharacterized protein LOC112596827 isoform X2 n=1 Tax=Melanaphis sacchari TaxID=742174 RepID=UPI000DC1557E|nr:uncharacterized protein LOC112596827 isoform X2 [Melanaphis sacchari]